MSKAFSLFIFVKGLLLIITSFTASKKLTKECPSSLKSKLGLAMVLGSAFMTLSIGYWICGSKCECKKGMGTTSLLALNTIIGVILLILVFSIKSDANKSGCKVNISTYINVLIGIGFFQVGVTLAYVAKKLMGKKSDEDEDDDDDYYPDEGKRIDLGEDEDDSPGFWKSLFSTKKKRKEDLYKKREKRILRDQRIAQQLKKERDVLEAETAAATQKLFEKARETRARENRERARWNRKLLPPLTMEEFQASPEISETKRERDIYRRERKISAAKEAKMKLAEEKRQKEDAEHKELLAQFERRREIAEAKSALARAEGGSGGFGRGGFSGLGGGGLGGGLGKGFGT